MRRRRVARIAGPPRVLFYAHNGRSAGHVAIVAALAAHLKQAMPHASLACVSGCRIGSTLMPEGVDYLKLPAFVSKATPQGIELRTYVEMDRQRFLDLRVAWLRSLIEHFDPDVFFVDDTPSGSFGELATVLPLVRGLRILGLRGIEDQPARYMRRLASEGGVGFIDRHYDRVFCFTDKRVIDVTKTYEMSALNDRFSYCGYLMRPVERVLRRRARGALRILASVGGDENFPLLKVIVESKRHLALPAQLTVYTGYSLGDDKFKQLEKMATAGVSVRRFSAGHFEEMCESDVYVGRGGYSTLVEILKARVPSIVIPWQNAEDEQLLHSQRLLELGGVTARLRKEECTPVALAKAITQLAEARARPKDTGLNLEGGPTAARLIRRLLPTVLSGAPRRSGR